MTGADEGTRGISKVCRNWGQGPIASLVEGRRSWSEGRLGPYPPTFPPSCPIFCLQYRKTGMFIGYGWVREDIPQSEGKSLPLIKVHQDETIQDGRRQDNEGRDE